MGWDFSHREPGMTTRAYFEREFSHGQSDAKTEFVGTAMVGSTFYAAVRDLASNEVFALVCLTQRQRGYYNFGYKSMDEGMGPDAAEMPSKILDLLTPTDSDWANEWRSRCRRNAQKAIDAAALQRGDIIRLSRPVQFSNYYEGVIFFLVHDAGAGRFVVLNDAHEQMFQCGLGRDWPSLYDWKKIGA